MNSLAFLEAIFAGKREEDWVLIWTLRRVDGKESSKESHWFKTVEGAADYVNKVNGTGIDIYFGVSLSPEALGLHRRVKADEVVAVTGAWVDIDIYHPGAHIKDNLPRTIEDALSLLPPDIPPTMIINTGHGLHVYWLHKEPAALETPEERAKAQQLVQRMQLVVQRRALAHNWTVDGTADLSRVLRVCGTANCKDNPPVLVTAIQTDGPRWEADDLLALLDDGDCPAVTTDGNLLITGDTGMMRAKYYEMGDGASIKKAARIDGEMVAGLCEESVEFKSTWSHTRKDFAKGDYSQSGYDLALANWAVAMGWTDQQVIDLIYSNRLAHGRKADVLDRYLARTIYAARYCGIETKLRNHLGLKPQPRLPETLNVAAVLAGTAEVPPPPADPAQPEAPGKEAPTREQMIEKLGELLSLDIRRVVKYATTPPTYWIDLEQGRVQFASLQQLTNQGQFILKVGETVDRMIPKVKGKQWQMLIEGFMSVLDVVEPAIDAQESEAMRMRLDEYLYETGLYVQDPTDRAWYRRPLVEDDKAISISHMDFATWLKSNYGSEWKAASNISLALQSIGAQATEIQVRGTRYGRWRLPVMSFQVDAYKAHIRSQIKSA
jgi:hypothetical protein